MDDNGYPGAVLMDLSKTLVTINHELLISKFHAYGFSKEGLTLIASYLSGRWQHVKINDTFVWVLFGFCFGSCSFQYLCELPIFYFILSECL